MPRLNRFEPGVYLFVERFSFSKEIRMNLKHLVGQFFRVQFATKKSVRSPEMPGRRQKKSIFVYLTHHFQKACKEPHISGGCFVASKVIQVFLIEIGRGLLLHTAFWSCWPEVIQRWGQFLDVNVLNDNDEIKIACPSIRILGMNLYRIDAGLEFDQSIGCVSFWDGMGDNFFPGGETSWRDLVVNCAELEVFVELLLIVLIEDDPIQYDRNARRAWLTQLCWAMSTKIGSHHAAQLQTSYFFVSMTWNLQRRSLGCWDR